MNKKRIILKSIKPTTDVVQETADNTATKKLDREGTEHSAQVDLRELMTYHEDGRCTNAFNLITSKPILMAAY